ncbi:MAG: glycosyltransferase [Candidatus Sumerlaeia bacterium]|nr:glycosyltransferase [Candidatus Sumerlaeia bacterium]
MAPKVRVFLFTYKRAHLLPRALDSLRNQTFTDWVCEVHNDDPDDDEPRRIVEATSDSRISYVHHEKNLGGLATYNLMFRPMDEPFATQLHDDEWWLPTFLERMVDTLEAHPDAAVLTCNQQHHEEMPDGSWRDTGRTTFPPDSPLIKVHWPHHRQVLGAFHADGAMMTRTNLTADWTLPEAYGFSGSEAARERMMPSPMLILGEPLAVFAVTRSTARVGGPIWGANQIMLAGTFLKAVRLPRRHMNELLKRRRRRPRGTNTFLLAALLFPGARYLLPAFTAGDWAFFLASVARHPGRMLATVRSLHARREVVDFLHHHTARRAAESPGPPDFETFFREF